MTPAPRSPRRESHALVMRLAGEWFGEIVNLWSVIGYGQQRKANSLWPHALKIPSFLKKVHKVLVGVFAMFASFSAIGHPSSGIVVNEQNEIFFVHTTRGVAKLDRDRKLSYVQQAKGGHWLCLDRQGALLRPNRNVSCESRPMEFVQQ